MRHRMARAFRTAGAAKGDAGRELRFLQLPMPGLVGAGDDMSRCGTDRCTIEIEANAVDQPLDMLFGKTRIGAGEAGLYAGEARLYAALDGVHFRRLARMRLQHCQDMMHGGLPVAGPEINRAGMRIVPA